MRTKLLPLAAALAFALPCAAALSARADAPPPVLYDISRLPAPVRLMRERILKAAKSGDIAALRPLFSGKSGQTRITPEGSRQDPITYLKEISADGQGLEVLASLAQILQSGAVRSAASGQEAAYVWPYFTAYPPQNLSKRQLVEAYEIMSVDDFDTIKELGHYIYYRLGISADGQWRFFLTGDDQANAAEETESRAKDSAGQPMPGKTDIAPLPKTAAPPIKK